jgi:6-phosphogluconolactonase (cycloisomerase 2 family)
MTSPALRAGRSKSATAALLVALSAAAMLTQRAEAQAAAPTVFVLNRFVSGAPSGSPGAVTSFRQNADGTLTFVANTDVGREPNSIALSPDGSLLAVGGGQTGSIGDELVLFQVNPNSTLSFLFSPSAGVPGSAFEMIWLSNDLLAVTETDTIGDNFIHVYRWMPDLPFLFRTDIKPTGNFTTSLAFDESRNFLYTQSSQGDDIIDRWAVNLATGRLTHVETVPNFDAPLDLTITADNHFLYTGGGSGIFSGGCDTCINGYDITDEELVIPLFNPTFSPVQNPAYLAASQNGHLFVGHGGNHVIISYQIDPFGSLIDTGLTLVTDSIVGIDSMGDYLFIADDNQSATIGDGVRGVWTYLIGADGLLTQVGNGPADTGAVPVMFEALELWPGTGEPLCLCEFDSDAAQVDVFDLLAYLDLWFVSAPAADVDGTAGVDVFDLLAFLDCWFPASSGTPCA